MAIDTDAIEQQIAEGITQPQSVTNDAGSVSMHPLSSQLAALRQLKSDQAAGSGKTGIKFSRLKMGGTIN